MKVLIVAPHPFYQERGTPIAVELLIRALSERKYKIDLLTFNEGSDVTYPGLTIHRVKPFPKIKNVRPGFSGKKLLLDILVFFKLINLMIRNRSMQYVNKMRFRYCPGPSANGWANAANYLRPYCKTKHEVIFVWETTAADPCSG